MSAISSAFRGAWTVLALVAALCTACSTGSDTADSDPTPTHFRSASDLAVSIQEGDLSSTELLELYLERIEQLNASLNAIVALDVEGARARAREADLATSRGERWGPLHGVPITVKDILTVTGMPTTFGSPVYSDFVPEENAAAVQRLLDGGAIVLGKTNTPLFAGDWQTYNDVYGTTNNPWDTSRTPGGSSGGSAAAVAAGLVAAEVGSDIAGSLRIPAHFTGIYGHNPTFGLVPREGHYPLVPELSLPPPPTTAPPPVLGVVGPLARSAKDLKLMLEVMTTSEQLPLPPPRAAVLQNFRVALWLTDPALETDQEVVDALQAVVDDLIQAGVSVVETHPDLDLNEHAEAHRQLRFAITRGLGLPPEELQGLLDERERLQGLWEAFFDDFDVLLAPTAPTAAIEHDLSPILSRTIVVNGEEQPYQSLDVWTGPAGFAGLPATTAPIGRTVSGLPLGVQIVGPYMGDLTTIGFAERLAERAGGFEAPPGY